MKKAKVVRDAFDSRELLMELRRETQRADGSARSIAPLVRENLDAPPKCDVSERTLFYDGFARFDEGLRDFILTLKKWSAEDAELPRTKAAADSLARLALELVRWLGEIGDHKPALLRAVAAYEPAWPAFVQLHTAKGELRQVIEKRHEAIGLGGALAGMVKLGSDSERAQWTAETYLSRVVAEAIGKIGARRKGEQIRDYADKKLIPYLRAQMPHVPSHPDCQRLASVKAGPHPPAFQAPVEFGIAALVRRKLRRVQSVEGGDATPLIRATLDTANELAGQKGSVEEGRKVRRVASQAVIKFRDEERAARWKPLRKHLIDAIRSVERRAEKTNDTACQNKTRRKDR
jgi:hypothetical protein